MKGNKNTWNDLRLFSACLVLLCSGTLNNRFFFFLLHFALGTHDNVVSVVALVLFNLDKRHDGHNDYHVLECFLTVGFITVANFSSSSFLRGCMVFCVIVSRVEVAWCFV